MARNLLAAIAAATLCMVNSSQLHAETTPYLQIDPSKNLNDVIRQAVQDRFQTGGPLRAERRNANAATTSINPTISAGAVKQGTIVVGQANSYPILQFTYNSKANPLESVSFTFTSPNAAYSYTYYYNPRTLETGGTVVFEPDVNARYWSQPGRWTLTSAQIFDVQYNYTEYDQAQLAAMFAQPYITVVNKGLVDVTPPVVTAGHVLTPSVSISSPVPTFRVSLTGTDDVSGIGISFVIIEPPGGTYGQTLLAAVPTPTKAGTVVAYASIFSGQKIGKWSITGYGLCDLAGNCFSDSKEADIKSLFGTTSFTVTK